MDVDNQSILKWSGTTFTVLGAAATALSLDPANIWLFNLGSILWLIASIRMREPSLIAVNAALLIIYVIAAAIRLRVFQFLL